jgi:hypothetical protein
MSYFDLRTDYLGWPIEHINGHRFGNIVRYTVQLLRKWLYLHKRIPRRVRPVGVQDSNLQ